MNCERPTDFNISLSSYVLVVWPVLSHGLLYTGGLYFYL